MKRNVQRSPTESKKFPIIRANNDTIRQVFGLFAAVEEIERAETEFSDRLKYIPNALRDLRMIKSVLSNLLVNILSTIPVDKLESIQRMSRRMHYNVTFGAQASQMETDEVLLTTNQVDIFARYAHEHCKLCVDMDCGRCDLGRTFDKTLTIDRDGGNWAFIDFDDIYKKG